MGGREYVYKTGKGGVALFRVLLKIAYTSFLKKVKQ